MSPVTYVEPEPVKPEPPFSTMIGGGSVKQDFVTAARAFVFLVAVALVSVPCIWLMFAIYDKTK